MNSEEKPSDLKEYLSPAGAWALSVGNSIGWGTFVVTSNTYLSGSGPLGSILGLLIGAAIMLVISKNYRYMMNLYRTAGGAYDYTTGALGHDYGFVSAWFLLLTYIAMFWANATSLPLFFEYIFGDALKFGPRYTIFDYNVYITEALVSVIAILLAALLCSKTKKAAEILMIFLVLSFIVEASLCFYAAVIEGGASEMARGPFFSPAGKNGHPIKQILRIALISPWAFIGFDNISNSAQEFSFPRKKAGGILKASIITSLLFYILVILLSVSARPAGYGTWHSYITDMANIRGLRAIPAFYAAERYLGSFGTRLLLCALFAFIATSLIANLITVSRLLFALSKNSVASKKYSFVTKKGIPANAIWAAAAVSAFVPFLGRTTVGWIIDVTTIGAVIIYGFLSCAAWTTARKERKTAETVTGFLGMALMILFGAFLIVPNILGESTFAKESYFLFTAWSILGIVFFHQALKKDKEGNFGQSIIVWIVLLSLALCMALIWMAKTDRNAMEDALLKINLYVSRLQNGAPASPNYIGEALQKINASNMESTIVVLGLFIISIGMLASNLKIMRKRDLEQREELGKVRALAERDPLTGVKSKHAYIEYENNLNKRIEGAAPGEKLEFAVLVCDVNGLKNINDTQGHKAGDERIREASSVICAIFKHSPVFRIGGDEFAVVLLGHDYERREELLKEFSAVSERNKAEGRVVIAAALSDFVQGQDKKAASVFDRADNLMYEKKKALKKAE